MAGVLLAACGGAATPGGAASPTAPPGSSSTAQSQAARGHLCRTWALKITLDTGAAGAAAGSYYVPLTFENVSASACALPAFPMVSFAAGAAGPDIGQLAAPEPALVAHAVTLGPAAIAHVWLQIVDAANYSPATCKPVMAAGLRVGLSKAASTIFVAHSILACARPPAGSIILGMFPVRPGPARHGTAP